MAALLTWMINSEGLGQVTEEKTAERWEVRWWKLKHDTILRCVPMFVSAPSWVILLQLQTQLSRLMMDVVCCCLLSQWSHQDHLSLTVATMAQWPYVVTVTGYSSSSHAHNHHQFSDPNYACCWRKVKVCFFHLLVNLLFVIYKIICMQLTPLNLMQQSGWLF